MSQFQIFKLFLYLGCISFGGPSAHLALFQRELVERRRWISLPQYVQLMSLCQVLPGPSSSQVGMALGYHQGGYRGAFWAWLGFTLPGATLLAIFAMGLMTFTDVISHQVIHGLKLAVLAIVAHAIIMMTKQICQSVWHYVLVAMTVMLGLVFEVSQLGIILVSAICGWVLFRQNPQVIDLSWLRVSKRLGSICLILFFLILAVLPLLAHLGQSVAFFHIFYRAGALVFGGGHVVLPLLEAEIVVRGWLDHEKFMTGYALAQTVPGPLFNFVSYLGVMAYAQQPLLGFFIAVIGVFLPAALIVFASLAFIDQLNRYTWVRSAFMGISAGVIGILILSLYDPLFIKTITDFTDIVMVFVALAVLYSNKVPVWVLVALCGIFGLLF